MKEEDGLVKVKVPAAGMNMVVLPKDGKWMSLDNQIIIEGVQTFTCSKCGKEIFSAEEYQKLLDQTLQA